MNNNLEKKNKFYLNDLYFYFLIFLITFVIFRIILPYGDEPDFYHRYTNFIFNFNEFNVYQNNFNQGMTCNDNYLNSSLFSLYSKISPFFCTNKPGDFLERVFYGFVLNLIFFYSIYFFFNNLKIVKFLKIETKYHNLNLHIFFCSMIFPSVIYYLGTKSNEIFLFYLSFVFFFVWKNYVISYFLSFIIILIDYGNGGIFFLFINFFYLFRFFVKFCGFKKTLLSIFTIILILALYERQVQSYVSVIFMKSETIFFQNMSRNVLDIDKNFIHPNYYKLIITYFSFVFLTPGFLKSVVFLVLMSIAILYTFGVVTGYLKNTNYTKSLKIKFFKDNLINSIGVVLFILIIILIFPTHSYIRYYIFVYPFISSLFFITLGPQKTFYLAIIGLVAVILETSLYRIFYFL